MARICPLFSGSTGNCTYIGTENNGILIDAGASAKGICQSLLSVGALEEEIKAIAVTHTHSDHIKGIKAILKKTGAKLIATKDTLSYLVEKELIPVGTEIIEIGNTPIDLGDISINSFLTSHDALGACGYTMEFQNGKRFSLCTDTGIVTQDIKNAILNSDAVLLESNHDIEMLKNGPYPPLLKVRIMSEKGHISNAVCAALAKELLKANTTRFILGHLSLNNNTPLIAKSTSESALMDLGAKNGEDYILNVAKPKDNGVTVI